MKTFYLESEATILSSSRLSDWRTGDLLQEKKKKNSQEINLAVLHFDSSMYCRSERYFAKILNPGETGTCRICLGSTA